VSRETCDERACHQLDYMLRQLALPAGHNLLAATRLVAMLEAVAPRLNEVDRLQLGRLMVSTGHAITLTCCKRA
jgi:hypothetical protein